MKTKAAKKVFLERLAAAGKKLDGLKLAGGIQLMLDFYKEERADGCEFDEDGDMLLFQWLGVDYDDEEPFEVDITRQLLEQDGDEPRQLSLTFKYKSTAALQKIGIGDKWCESTKKLATFRKFITSHKAMKAVATLKPLKVELAFGRT